MTPSKEDRAFRPDYPRLLTRDKHASFFYPERKTEAIRQWRLRRPNMAAVHDRKKRLHRFGLTLAQYDDIARSQNWQCAICGIEDWAAPKGILCVDHDHATGRVRGLLCRKCNAGLGMFNDNSAVVVRAVRYLSCAT